MKTFPRKIQLRDTGGTVAAVPAAEGQKLRRFSLTAYTGAVVSTCINGMSVRLIVNLSGITPSSQAIPLLNIHELGDVLGHTDAVGVDGGVLRADGVFSGAAEDTAPVIEAADNGFPWQASARFRFDEDSIVFLPEGMTMTVNGLDVEGPLAAAMTSWLDEVSITAIGADNKTNVSVLSSSTTDGETVTVTERVPMSDKTTVPTAEQLAAAQAEGRAAGVKLMADLNAAFPDDPGFAVAQFAIGHSVTEANAAYVPVLRAKLAKAESEKGPGVIGVSGGDAGKGEKEKEGKADLNARLSSGDHEVRAKAEWEADPTLADKWPAGLAGYIRIRKAELSGRFSVFAPKGTVPTDKRSTVNA